MYILGAFQKGNNFLSCPLLTVVVPRQVFVASLLLTRFLSVKNVMFNVVLTRYILATVKELIINRLLLLENLVAGAVRSIILSLKKWVVSYAYIGFFRIVLVGLVYLSDMMQNRLIASLCLSKLSQRDYGQSLERTAGVNNCNFL